MNTNINPGNHPYRSENLDLSTRPQFAGREHLHTLSVVFGPDAIVYREQTRALLDLDVSGEEIHPHQGSVNHVINHPDRSPTPEAGCRLLGYRVPTSMREVLDTYFTEVDVSESDRVRFILKSGVTPLEALRSIDALNIKEHAVSLFPSKELQNSIPGIDVATASSVADTVMLGIEGTNRKDRQEMSDELDVRGMQLSSRLGTVLALNLNLLLTAENALADKRELRDDTGSLFATMSGMHSHVSDAERGIRHDNLFAAGSKK